MDNDNRTDLYGVIGHPVAHSLSPFLMNRAFRQTGTDAVYLRFDVRPDSFDRAIDALATLGARGANVTYPYKEKALERVDVATPEAELIGGINTLVFRDGRIIGSNTDAEGAAAALSAFAAIPPRGRRFFIFGAGASARAAGAGLLRHGAARVTFGVRTPGKYTNRVAKLQKHRGGQPVDIVAVGETRREGTYYKRFTDADVVINATPAGMGENSGRSPLDDPAWIRPGQCYFDFIYHPGRTRFLASALEKGATVLGGVSLLVCQAVESFRQWTGRDFDAGAMREALEAAFPERAIV